MLLIYNQLSDGSCPEFFLIQSLSMMCSTLRNITRNTNIKKKKKNFVLLLFVTVNSPFMSDSKTGFVALVFSLLSIQKTFAHSCIIIIFI